jgi:hypothetical protein
VPGGLFGRGLFGNPNHRTISVGLGTIRAGRSC